MPGMGWGELFRHVVARAASPAQPWLTLAAAAAVLKLVPALGALFALRLPDVLAAAVVAGALARLAGSRSTGILAALLFVASPVLWGTVAGTPGLVVDAAAAIVLYATMRESAVRPAPGMPLACLLAVVVLIGNGAGVYAIAIGLGVWLHTGLARGEWRLFASARLTALAGLVIAGLTLVNVLALPRMDARPGLVSPARHRDGTRRVAYADSRSSRRRHRAQPGRPRRDRAPAGRRGGAAGADSGRRRYRAFFCGDYAAIGSDRACADPVALVDRAAGLDQPARRRVLGCRVLCARRPCGAVAALLVVGRGEPAASTALVWLSRDSGCPSGLGRGGRARARCPARRPGHAGDGRRAGTGRGDGGRRVVAGDTAAAAEPTQL